MASIKNEDVSSPKGNNPTPSKAHIRGRDLVKHIGLLEQNLEQSRILFEKQNRAIDELVDTNKAAYAALERRTTETFNRILARLEATDRPPAPSSRELLTIAPAFSKPVECATCVVDPKVAYECYRVGQDVERCRHCALGKKTCLPVPRRDWARANEVIRAKQLARESQRREDIRAASKLAIRLRKHFTTSNSVAAKECGDYAPVVDELRAIGAQVHLSLQLQCAQAGVSSGMADYFDRPVTPIVTDEELKEDSSEFGSIDSNGELGPSDGFPAPRRPKRPKDQLPPCRVPQPRHASQPSTPTSSRKRKAVENKSSDPASDAESSRHAKKAKGGKTRSGRARR